MPCTRCAKGRHLCVYSSSKKSISNKSRGSPFFFSLPPFFLLPFPSSSLFLLPLSPFLSSPFFFFSFHLLFLPPFLSLLSLLLPPFSFFASFSPFIAEQIEMLFTIKKNEEVLLSTTQLNSYLVAHYGKMSNLFNSSMEETLKYFAPFSSKPGKLQTYAVLSLQFRNDGHFDYAEKFLR